MDADFLFKKETDLIIGCAFAVLNELGHGFHEKPYENALAIEFRHRGLLFEQQLRFPMLHRGEKISDFVPDLIVFGKIEIDTKAIDQVTDVEIGQMINHLKIPGLPVGLILNFKNAKLEFRRVVATTQRFIHPQS